MAHVSSKYRLTIEQNSSPRPNIKQNDSLCPNLKQNSSLVNNKCIFHSLTSIHDPGNVWNWPLKHWNGLKHWKHWKGLKHWNEWNTEKGSKTRKRCLAWNKLVLPCWLLAVWIRRKYSEFLSFKKINLSQGVTSFNWGGRRFWQLSKIIFLLQPSQTLHKSGLTHNSQAKQ